MSQDDLDQIDRLAKMAIEKRRDHMGRQWVVNDEYTGFAFGPLDTLTEALNLARKLDSENVDRTSDDLPIIRTYVAELKPPMDDREGPVEPEPPAGVHPDQARVEDYVDPMVVN